MKRIALLLLLALGCRSQSGPKINLAASGNGPTYGTIDLLPTAPGVSDPGMIRLANTAGTLQTSTNGGAFSAIGGGLSAIPNNNFLGNTSGGSAVPTAQTTTQVLTALGVTPYGDPRATALIRAQALLGATATVAQYLEFDNNGTYVATVLGSGTGALSTADKGGVVIAATGATASSTTRIRFAGLPSSVDNFRTSKWYAYWRAAMITASDSASECSFLVSNVAGQTRFEFGMVGTTSTTNWSVFFRDPSGSTITNFTALAATVDTNYHDVEMWDDGTNFNIAYDGVSQYTKLVSATAGTEAAAININVSNGATAANRQINADRMIFITASN